MSSSNLDSQLDLLERQLHDVRARLVDGNALELQSASTQLQALAVDLVHLADAVGRQALGQQGRLTRLRRLSAGLGMVRDNLARQAALVDHALALVVPGAQQASTYSGSGRGYGSPARRSGAFSVLAA